MAILFFLLCYDLGKGLILEEMLFSYLGYEDISEFLMEKVC